LVKSLNDEGESIWSFRRSEPLNPKGLLSALAVQTDVLRNKLVKMWDDEGGETSA
jgi:hypothetical protein